MLLSNIDIQGLAAQYPPLIDPFVSSNVRLSSYDLTIGDEYYISADGKSSAIVTQHLLPNQSFTIPPHGICFILSEEDIHLPKDITAKISLRMSLVYRGLVLTSQPPFDPGYSGKAVVMVHNLSSEAHHLKRGSRIATIEFLKVQNSSTPGSPSVHRSVTSLMGQLTAPVTSSLSEISAQAVAAQKQVTWLSGQMLVFAALVVAILAIPGFYSYASFADRLSDQKAKIDDLSKQVDDQWLELRKLHQQITPSLSNNGDDTHQRHPESHQSQSRTGN
jgi:deoxycytidine triphosphate deaminase